MATLDRPTPSPDSFRCEPWSSFVGAAASRVVVNSSPDDRDEELPPHLREAAPLRQQEMLVDSQFPALEDFTLVVCHVCDKVVTPQGIPTHYGSWGVVSL